MAPYKYVYDYDYLPAFYQPCVRIMFVTTYVKRFLMLWWRLQLYIFYHRVYLYCKVAVCQLFIKLMIDWLIRSRCRLWADSCGPKESCISWGPDPQSLLRGTLQKINNGIRAPLLRRTAMLPTGRCHITLSRREKSATCDAAFRKNSLTTCSLFILLHNKTLSYRQETGATRNISWNRGQRKQIACQPDEHFQHVFTARRKASAVYICCHRVSVRLSIRHKSKFYKDD